MLILADTNLLRAKQRFHSNGCPVDPVEEHRTAWRDRCKERRLRDRIRALFASFGRGKGPRAQRAAPLATPQAAQSH